MIKAIIFDCFGVLTSDGWLPYKEKFFSDNPDKYQEATNLNALANENKISYKEFVKKISDLAHTTETETDKAMHKNQQNMPIFELIKKLKENYKIGLLSNISGDWLSDLFTNEQLELFDATALSYETGYAKPSEDSYKIIADRLGCQPNECIFIDDQISFVEASNKLGMKAIHYKGIESLATDLDAVLEMSNTDK
jgi:HAD superfamily hydrolase (TIGR01509 family)